MSVYKIIEKLNEDNSRLFKIKVLNDNLYNNDLQKVFVATLNPQIQYYIKKIPGYTANHHGGNLSIVEALEELTILSSRQKTGHEGVAHLKNILEQCYYKDAKIIERVIGRDLRCGVSTSTINKVWKGLIPNYPVMLASPSAKKSRKKIKFPSIVQTKMDGLRCNAIIDGETVTFRSRSGKLIDILGVHDEFFLKLANRKNIVFDGELLVKKGKKFLDRKTGNGILNKAIKGTITKEEASQVHMVIWDAILLEKFVLGFDNTPYETRLNIIQNNMFPNSVFSVINTSVVNSWVEAVSIFEQMLKEGEEGIIIKNINSPWENKISSNQFKMKASEEIDLEVIGWQEGTGKYKGQLGALTCQSRCKKLKVSPGIGYSDSERKTLTEKNTIGKIVSIKYNEIITKKGDKLLSLFLPVFVEIRNDKEEADAV